MKKENTLTQFGDYFRIDEIKEGDIESNIKELYESVEKYAEEQGYVPFPETGSKIVKEKTIGYTVWCIEKSKLVGE